MRTFHSNMLSFVSCACTCVSGRHFLNFIGHVDHFCTFVGEIINACNVEKMFIFYRFKIVYTGMRVMVTHGDIV